ncbi:MAG TPA: hypothetical protein VLI05_01025 [Candidatus Saccharimonadia bacterium]|nr:hypothetical protein [Candidatus Saccharimonadia bacterium]
MKQWLAWLGYGLLGLLILGPLLRPGYILALDMSWVPQLRSPAAFTSSWPFYELLWLVGLVLPSMVIQKLVLVACLAVAGVGAYWLVRRAALLNNEAAGCLAGVFYIVNPFVYTRLMAGQYLVLLGYALLPWFVGVLWRLLDRPSWRLAAILAALAAAIGFVSIHDIGLMAVVSLVSAVAVGWGRGRRLWQIASWLGAVAAGWLAANLFWLVPFILGRSPEARQVAGFGADQYVAYATTSDGVGVSFNTLILQGFWDDPHGSYVLPSSRALFWVAVALLAVLIILGLWRTVRERDRLGLALTAAGVVGWALAMGVAGPGLLGLLSDWLLRHVPFYEGYREPQKWLALSALAYAYLAGIGLAWALTRLRDWVKEATALAASMLPLAAVPMLLWGAGGQLRSADYPASWYALAQQLAAEPANGRILALPWHEYIGLNFAGRTVANPAPAFFGPRLVSSDNPELLGARSTTRQPLNDAIETQVLAGSYYVHDAGFKLATLGVSEVILFKQGDWTYYDWLNHQTDLVLVAESSGWKRYRVKEIK